MKSQRFELLRAKRPVLADLAAFAERYAHDDPSGSLVKQRRFVEHLVAMLYDAYRLRPPAGDRLHSLMTAEAFRSSVPEVVRDKLHIVRLGGNDASHIEAKLPITSQRALECLEELFHAAAWFHVTVDGGAPADVPSYSPPVPQPDGKQTLERLRLAEARQEATFLALEEETRKRLAAERAATEHANEPANEQVQQQRLKEGQKVASILHFDEQATRRRLIDHELRAAGWDVGANGLGTDQVGQEVPLTTMPTGTGNGFVDYVLYGDDGKPLAVVEAKRVAKDAQSGGGQARIYADCLEKETGVRPVVFFTNGVDLYLSEAPSQPDRKVYGYYSKDSLEYLVYKRANKKVLATIEPNLAIVDRMYQLEAVQRVCERFSGNHRQALLVQATGTGKTRVAISLCDVLMRAGWVKRILFLCDRKELRKQADNVFKEFMPGEPRVIVSRTTADDRNNRIYLATYPAMMKCYERLDVGFFDLVIADESHRSLYDHYSVLFKHFDALQVGLTATPVELTHRDTYKLFGCAERKPTFEFGFHAALEHDPPYLVPFRVRSCSSVFREEGIRYSQLSEAQQARLDDQSATAETIDFDAKDLDDKVFNRATTRAIWRTLMDEGIREATGSQVGKTIVFARSHLHALHLAEVFAELYPQYGSAFCQVIDTKISHAEHLIDDFKDPANALTIAISVDMLDTGIDVPEVVNLVLAKAVRSKVKFWQMLGRGTRLRKDLFGPGRDKTEFLVFDHGANFPYFEFEHRERQAAPQKSLLQRLFEARIELSQAALDQLDQATFQATAALIVGDVRALLGTKSFDVRDKRRELEALADEQLVAGFAPVTQTDLRSIAGPLQHLRPIRGEEDAYGFDLQMTRLQLELVKGGPNSPMVQDLRARVQNAVEQLAKNLEAVKAKAAAIKQVRSKEFWAGAEPSQLEGLREALRGIMRYQQTVPTRSVAPLYLDIEDTGFTGKVSIPRLDGLDLIGYKRRVEAVLSERFSDDAVVLRVRAGEVVGEDELEAFAGRLLEVDDHADLVRLAGRGGEGERSLLAVLRGLVGIDVMAVERAFAGFVERHPRLDARQLRFLQLLRNHIANNGGIEIARLYEPPFTTIHPESVDGVFSNADDVEELLALVSELEPKAPAS